MYITLFVTILVVFLTGVIPLSSVQSASRRAATSDYFKQMKFFAPLLPPLIIGKDGKVKRARINYARNGSLKVTDKVKQSLMEILKTQKLPTSDTLDSAIGLDDFFDGNGMIFLSQPRNNEIRQLNKIMNKAVALRYGGPVNKDEDLSPKELQVLDGVAAGLDGVLRAKDDEPNIAYNFDELVA